MGLARVRHRELEKRLGYGPFGPHFDPQAEARLRDELAWEQRRAALEASRVPRKAKPSFLDGLLNQMKQEGEALRNGFENQPFQTLGTLFLSANPATQGSMLSYSVGEMLWHLPSNWTATVNGFKQNPST